MKTKTTIWIFKSVIVMCFVGLAWVACDILDSYDFEWPTYDKTIENSKIRFDSNGNRMNGYRWE